MPRFHRFGAVSAIAASLSMVVTPALAVELPNNGRVTVQAHDDGSAMSRRGSWGRHHRHRGGIDGGDILAGVLILGGIAAVASAVENNNRDRDYRDYPPPPPRQQDRYDYRSSSTGSSGGLDRAADICADAVEQSVDRVGSVDNVRRSPSGWEVDGSLEDGSPFTCSIDNDGRIRDVQTDRNYRGAGYSGAPSYSDPGYVDQSHGSQYDDETYARLRGIRDGLSS